MTVVVDASAVVAALVDRDADGTWAEAELVRDDLAAPHLMPVEVANILRRAVLARHLTPDSATLAHGDLLRLRVQLFPYEISAERAWQLRANLSAYDAWYVALAESLDAPFVTLDRRMARARGPRCAFRLPPAP
ncbi:MAG: type II toxin-antitoxin system VapC family toxin [Candidatus Limnocylindria bacterium]